MSCLFYLIVFIGLNDAYASQFIGQCVLCNTMEMNPLSNDLMFNISDAINDNFVLEPFSVNVFNNLRNVDEAVNEETVLGKVIERDNILSVFGQLLIEYGLNDIMGASILHNHYHLQNDNEIVVLTDAGETRGNDVFVTYVKNIAFNDTGHTVEDALVPYMFKYEYNVENNTWNMYPLQYIIDLDGSIRQRFVIIFDESNIQLLSKIGSLLYQNDMMDKIGIFIKHYNADQVLSERTNTNKRTQTFVVQNITTNLKNKLLVTAFSWKGSACPSSGTAIAGCNCAATRDCNAWCVDDGDGGHNSGHSPTYGHIEDH
eukprot:115715_1